MYIYNEHFYRVICTRSCYSKVYDYIRDLSSFTASTVGKTKSNFHTHTLPSASKISNASFSVYPIFRHCSISFSSLSSHIKDFRVAKTGSVPRNGEWDGYKADVRL